MQTSIYNPLVVAARWIKNICARRKARKFISQTQLFIDDFEQICKETERFSVAMDSLRIEAERMFGSREQN